MELLRKTIQPHFIMNTLISIIPSGMLFPIFSKSRLIFVSWIWIWKVRTVMNSYGRLSPVLFIPSSFLHTPIRPLRRSSMVCSISYQNPFKPFNHHDWSPDGQKLAAVGYVSAETWSIYVFDADGTDLIRLTTTNDVNDSEPVWSPDETKIYLSDSRQPRWIVLFYLIASFFNCKKKVTSPENHEKIVIQVLSGNFKKVNDFL